MSSVFKFWNEDNLPPSDIKLAGQLGFVSNAVGRLGFGALSDAIGFKKTYFMVMCL